MPFCNLTRSKTFPPTTIFFSLAKEAHTTSFPPEKIKHLPTPSAFNLLMDRINLASFWECDGRENWPSLFVPKSVFCLKEKKEKERGGGGKNTIGCEHSLVMPHLLSINTFYAFYHSLNMTSLKKHHFTEHMAETP